MTTRTTASAVSRKLRALGYKPLTPERARQWGGIHVSGMVNVVSVAIHDGDDREVDAIATAKDVYAELVKAGYDVDEPKGSASFASVWVNGRADNPKPSVAPRPQDRGRWAQDMIMQAVAAKIGYWQEDERYANVSQVERVELDLALRKQADRVARLFGFDKAWVA